MAWTTTNLGGQRASGANIREDLSNTISNIDRDETPFLSSIGSNKATGPLHEWLTDTFQDPTENVQEEGFTFSSSTAEGRQNARTRLDNRTQIYGKNIVTSGSAISSDVAGVANEFAYQLKKAGVELRRDIERSAVTWVESGNENNVIKVSQMSNVNGEAASVFAYVANWVNATSAGVLRQIAGGAALQIGGDTAGTRVALGGGANAQYNAANAFAADGGSTVNFASAPTRVSFARSQLEDLLALMHNAGGKPSMMQVPTMLRTDVSAAFATGTGDVAAQRRIDEMAKKLNISIMGVVTDFGYDIGFTTNYIMDQYAGAANALLVYDPKMAKRSILTPMATEEDRVARYGRAAIMYCEETLEVMNQRSFGAIVGVSNA